MKCHIQRLIYLLQIIQLLPFMNTTFFFSLLGIYVPEDDRDAPEKFRGLGVRIEDDVVVTQDSPLILSADCPKEMSDIEQICSRASWASPQPPCASGSRGVSTGICALLLSECLHVNIYTHVCLGGWQLCECI